MAKTKITVESDFNELISDLLDMTDHMEEDIQVAADKQLSVLTETIKQNWVSMVPHGKIGDYVYDSIGYNVGVERDVVGMSGVFLIDHVVSSHNITKEDIKAPTLAYWVEYGYTPNNAVHQAGIPFMGSAYLSSTNEQDEVFADSLQDSIAKRLSK